MQDPALRDSAERKSRDSLLPPAVGLTLTDPPVNPSGSLFSLFLPPLSVFPPPLCFLQPVWLQQPQNPTVPRGGSREEAGRWASPGVSGKARSGERRRRAGDLGLQAISFPARLFSPFDTPRKKTMKPTISLALLRRGEREGKLRPSYRLGFRRIASNIPSSYSCGVPKPPEAAEAEGGGQMRGHPPLAKPARALRGGNFSGEGAGTKEISANLSSPVCCAPTPSRPRARASSSAWRLALRTGTETAASIQLRTQLHTLIRRAQGSPPPLRTRSSITHHGTQIHKHSYSQSHAITYAQRCSKHAQPHLTVIHRLLSNDTKPGRKHKHPSPSRFSFSIHFSAHHFIHTCQEPTSLKQKRSTFQKKLFNFFQRKKAI